ncbi:hypothetical protein [Glycomyces sp. NPDC021274]|uniref:YobI family P-loop NTPase n=1 Tax=Glycomyces sp. NPDC021274 TaxID=3155120 RepID=UPI0033CDA62A
MPNAAKADGEKSHGATLSPTDTDSTPISALPVRTLASLAPRYEDAQHGTYLRRLAQEVAKPDHLNIALTGRYGTGKSSVLGEFEKQTKLNTLRLSISTLGPNGDDTTLTNRIQKELVKQLIYSASPTTMRHSRFRRRVPLSLWRPVVEAAVSIALIWGFLALMGWLPAVAGTGPEHPWFVRTAAWFSLAAIVGLVFTVVRHILHDRYVIADLSAAGATVKLSERSHTYFDEYLDDIVNYFDTEEIDVVIFEDLDRFNDPQIFEALRELNTLLNNTRKRTRKKLPLRFIYAVRDSLFEKLGTDSKAEGDDAARAETVRANRTKFFDIVIPMVPFISHRNARDLLGDLLKEKGITGIDRQLVDLVARYSTDMRLLNNICNEYQEAHANVSFG